MGLCSDKLCHGVSEGGVGVDVEHRERVFAVVHAAG